MQLDYLNALKVLRDVDMMACLGKSFQQWIVSEKKECLCTSVLQEGNSKFISLKGSDRCGHGVFVVIHWKSSNNNLLDLILLMALNIMFMHAMWFQCLPKLCTKRGAQLINAVLFKL